LELAFNRKQHTTHIYAAIESRTKLPKSVLQ